MSKFVWNQKSKRYGCNIYYNQKYHKGYNFYNIIAQDVNDLTCGKHYNTCSIFKGYRIEFIQLNNIWTRNYKMRKTWAFEILII